MGILLFAALPVLLSIQKLSNAGVRDHLDIYAQMMGSPIGLVLPLAAVLLTGLPIYFSLTKRWIANTRSRVGVRTLLVTQTARAAWTAFIAFFLFAFVPFVVAFYVWPTIGDPGIDPDGYFLTPESVVLDSFNRVSYSSLLESGPLYYGITYSIWLGLTGAMYSVLGIVSLALVPNKTAALVTPFALYLFQTVGAALLGEPQWGLLYSALPFGLAQSPLLEAAAATLILAALTSVAFSWLVVKAPTISAFS